MNPPDKYARIVCVECGPQFLTEAQYDKQMDNPHKGWRCPVCWCYPCEWDDEYFEQNHTSQDASDDPMICEDCEKVTLLTKANVRLQTLENTFNKLDDIEHSEWQCSHCGHWNK